MCSKGANPWEKNIFGENKMKNIFTETTFTKNSDKLDEA
jgi:hypothetical protein